MAATVYLMALVGLGLVAFYNINPPGPDAAALLGIAFLALWRRGRPRAITAGVAASIAAVIALRILEMSFFWWYLAACLIVIAFALVPSYFTRKPDPLARTARSPTQ